MISSARKSTLIEPIAENGAPGAHQHRVLDR
jgi:hypothetical protein